MTVADPAFRGFIETTLDALLVFEGCRRNQLPKITRRLSEDEKRDLVVSGAVFVFDEEDTGIKRWTDGLTWSPSRTLGNFLVYRELDKKANLSAAAAAAAEGDPDEARETASTRPVLIPPSARRRSASEEGSSAPPLDRARERALVGSLTSSYRFRADGLVKKTISLSGLHMIGYYKIDDVTSGRLRTPSSHAELAAMEIDSSFLSPSLFRVPPLVETGPDGRMRYKGEADAPLSPLPRTGSSQGVNTPGTHSRPASSDSTGPRGSPRIPPLQLGVAGPSSQREVPNSPHRGGTSAFRSANRYDPYSIPRQSPNVSSYAPASSSTSSSAYPFPEASDTRPSSGPHGGFVNLSGVDETYRLADGTTGLSPAIGMLSSSAPSEHHWLGPPHDPPHSAAPPSSHQYHPMSAQHHHPHQYQQHQTQQSQQPYHGFYQPRHATPFSPSDPVASTSTSSNAIFRYAPPPPPLNPSVHQQDRRPETSGGPSPPTAMSYSSYSPPLSAGSNASASFSSFGPVVSSSAQQRAVYPTSYPTSHQYSPGMAPPYTGQDRPPSSSGGLPYGVGAIGMRPPSSAMSNLSSSSSSSYDYAPPPPSSTRYYSSQPQRSQYSNYATADPRQDLAPIHVAPPGSSGGSVPRGSTGGASSYSYASQDAPYDSSGGARGATGRQPSGMVMALGPVENDDAEGREGLGLRAGAPPHPSGHGKEREYSQDVRVKREHPKDDHGSWGWSSNTPQ